jgi:hypothetical protein
MKLGCILKFIQFLEGLIKYILVHYDLARELLYPVNALLYGSTDGRFLEY